MTLLWCALVAGGLAQVGPDPVPAANVNGVTVGGGWVEATNRQVVRTAGNEVYIVVSDDNPCNSTRSTTSGVIRVYKGSGAQAANPNVPIAFSEVDASHHPASAGTGSCIYADGAHNLLFAPDIKLDNNGIIHAAYIDPNATNNGKVYYQTFDTNSDLWRNRVQVATGAQTNVGGGWPRGSHAVLVLDANGIPYIVFASGGTSNSIRWVARTASGGTAWSTAATIPGSTGTNQFQPSMVTALDGTIHLAWCNNCLAAHPTIRYAKFFSGAWGAVETVSSGDSNVLGDADHDQIPAIATDLSSRPHVLYLDGTASGSDNYVRMRYRTSDGMWTDNTPPGTAGPSNPNGTWYCHTPSNYISSNNDIYVFLGHDRNISPGPYQYQIGGVGNNWSSVNQLDPRNQTNTTAGAPGLDGSASIRFDPLRDNNPSIIDVIYYDENDGTPGYAHHATVYYKALDMYSLNPTNLSVTPINLSFSANQGGGNPASSTVNVTNTGTGALSFTAVSDSPWLTASPAGGNTPQALTVAVNTSGLAPGGYPGHITVTSTAAQNLPLTITVALTVTAVPTLSSIALNPTSVVGGNSSTGTVTLTGPAPAGGVIVPLTSDNVAGQVPVSVTVPGTATSTNFSANTSSVTAATTVTISGTYNNTTKSATLGVRPAVPVTLSSVTVNPASLVGGNSATGTVTLSGVAPTGGIVVSLTSDNAAGQVPVSVTVAANTTSANFTVTTSSVTTVTTVTISGTYSSTTKTATLAVAPVPVILSSVTVNPTSLVGGNSATGTVTLSGPAPTGSIIVPLTSNNSAAQVQPSVIVAANATNANFTVTTSSVTSAATVTISGTYNGTAKNATLTLTPVPLPPPLVLSSVTVNPITVVGGNNSVGTVTISGVAPAGGATVTLSSNSTSAQVPAGVLVSAGATSATFTVTTAVVSTSTLVTITGQYGGSQIATLTVTPATRIVLFGDQAIESNLDSDSRGKAEAFQTTATASGTLSSLTVYLDSTSTATTIYIGLYADNGGHPGALLSQGTSTQLTNGSWNVISTLGIPITSGTKYWIAILGTTTGTPFFRDRHNGACKSETSQQTTLAALPATWITGTVYADCPISAYGR